MKAYIAMQFKATTAAVPPLAVGAYCYFLPALLSKTKLLLMKAIQTKDVTNLTSGLFAAF